MRAFSRLMLTAAAVVALSACSKADLSVQPDDWQQGKATAPVTVIEYASTSCGHCAVFNNESFPQLKSQYIDTGKVRYVFREFLTPPESFASASFLLARCAGKDRYFSVVDAVFHAQADIFESQDIRGGLLQIAKSAGMTEAEFDKCIADPKEREALNKRVTFYSKEAKITGTPTFVINGQAIMDGQTPQFKHVAAAIDAAQAGKTGKDIDAAAKAAK